MRIIVHVLVVALFLISACAPATKTSDPWKEAEGILSRIKAPTFPDKDFLITAYGAAGDSVTDCTEAFKKAIQACHDAGDIVNLAPHLFSVWVTNSVAIPRINPLVGLHFVKPLGSDHSLCGILPFCFRRQAISRNYDTRFQWNATIGFSILISRFFGE